MFDVSRNRELLKTYVVHFVRDFDCKFEYDIPIAKLTEAGAWHQPENDASTEEMLLFIGLAYCEMIRADIMFRIGEGLAAQNRSEATATKLAHELEQGSLPEEDLEMARYVVSRWYDAYGRLVYRTGNYAIARLNFERAHKIALTQSVSALSLDTLSNLNRATCEEFRTYLPTFQIRLLDFSKRVIMNCKKLTKELSDAIDGIAIDELAKDRELNRAYVSCMHNAITIEQYQSRLLDAADAKKYLDADFLKDHQPTWPFTISKLIELSQADTYRNAQSLLAHVQSEKSQKNFDSALNSVDELQSLPWRRGKLIARQNRADIQSKLTARQTQADLQESFDELYSLFTLQFAQAVLSGGIDKSDIDFLHWTLRFAEAIPITDSSSLPRLREMQEKIVSLVSQVASIDAYRSVFEQYSLPRLRQVWGDKLKGFLAKGKLSISERRELELAIDAMDSHFGRNTIELQRTTSRAMLTTQQLERDIKDIFVSRKPKNPSSVAGELACCEMASVEDAVEAIREKQTFSEERSLAQPLRFTHVPGSVSMMAMEYTALRSDNPCIIQYRNLHISGKDLVVATVWFGGRLLQVELPDALNVAKTTRNDECVLENAASEGTGKQIYDAKIPNRAFGEKVWRAFFAPILDALSKVTETAGNSAQDREVSTKKTWGDIGRLVLIPETDCSIVPLNLAWRCGTETEPTAQADCPIAAEKPIAFSMSLTAFLGSHRCERNDLKKLENEDVALLWNFPCSGCNRGKVDCCPSGEATSRVLEHFDEIYSKANKEVLTEIAIKQPELLFLGMHGSMFGSGIALQFEDGYVTNFMLERSSFLNRTRLVLLGACESIGVDNWFSSMIASFIAASAGAVIGMPRRAYIKTIAELSIHLHKEYSGGHLLQLDSELKKFCAAACRDKSDADKIMWCLPQLWL